MRMRAGSVAAGALGHSHGHGYDAPRIPLPPLPAAAMAKPGDGVPLLGRLGRARSQPNAAALRTGPVSVGGRTVVLMHG